jgi:hypothetical protein
MDVYGYICEVVKFKEIPLGIDSLEEQFLHHILHGHKNAYQMRSLLKKEGTPMAYKNVHRRIKKLFEANLIEEIKIEGGFKHGARNYKLTTRGLVYIFSELGAVLNINKISTYSENILFKTLVYPYFERNTIKYATYSLIGLIESYLEECCQITRYALEFMVEYIEPGTNMTAAELVRLPPIAKLQIQLNWHIKSFIVKTAIMKEGLIKWDDLNEQRPHHYFPSRGKIKCTANDRLETFSLLSEDKKFMNALEEIEEEFSEGYDKLIELKNKKKNS